MERSIITIRAFVGFALLLSGCEMKSSVAIRTPASVANSPDNPSVNSSAATPLSLASGPASVGIGHTATFTATGGVSPYTFSASSGAVVARAPSSGSVLVDFSAPYTPQTVTLTVRDALGRIASASISVTVGTLLRPNDSLFSQQIGFSQASNIDINAPEAWAIHTDCTGTLVGILDSGTDLNHPDLAANIWTNPREIAGNGADEDGNGYADDLHGWNFYDGNADVNDQYFHGTHLAGVIGAVGNNGTGLAGICWKASLVTLKFMDPDGSGFTSDAIDAVYYAADLGVKVINASFGGSPFEQTFQDAINYAGQSGALFVVAAGNETNNNDATPSYPASYSSSNLIAVASTGATDVLSSFSNFGATSVHIAAPGENILSTFPTTMTAAMTTDGFSTYYQKISGTSMATPHVAGAAALYLSFNPGASVAAVRSRILQGGDVVSGLNGKVAGSVRLNLRKVMY